MDSRRNRERLSGLPDFLLVLIISNLPFKEAVKTSALGKRWENLYRETTNLTFKESEFVKSSVSDSEESVREARVSFVRFMVNWVSRFPGNVIESFQIHLYKPVEFETEIKFLIEFAVSKKVKNLVLDFSDHSCNTSNQAAGTAVVFHLPECVYNMSTLESLKLFACGFDPSKFPWPCSIKSLCFGWMELGNIIAMLLKCPLLESLTLQNCWNVSLESITGYNIRLRELIFKNCEFARSFTLLDLPSIKIFKYTGKLHCFYFMTVNRLMEEVYLDYGDETGKDYVVGRILYDLSSAKKLTVCPYVIQAIRDIDNKVRSRAQMETKHLVIKTNLVPDEFVGIRLMINTCPELETLTFQMLPPIPEPTTKPGFCPDTYWTHALGHECLKKTLKVVEVRSFTGGTYEVAVLRFLIRWGVVLERVDLYLPLGTSESDKTLARALMRTLRDESEAASDRLCICLYDGEDKDIGTCFNEDAEGRV